MIITFFHSKVPIQNRRTAAMEVMQVRLTFSASDRFLD